MIAFYFFLGAMALIAGLMILNLIIGKQALVKYLAVNSVTACCVVVIAALAVQDSAKACYLDVALVYALVSFVVNVAIMKYYEGTRC